MKQHSTTYSRLRERMDTTPPTLGNKLRSMRILHGLTLKQAAAQAQGYSVSHLSEVERGVGTPSLAMLEALAHLYGTTSAALLADVAQAQPQDDQAREETIHTLRGVESVSAAVSTGHNSTDTYLHGDTMAMLRNAGSLGGAL